MMIYGSGQRVSEAVNLRIQDIDSKNGTKQTMENLQMGNIL